MANEPVSNPPEDVPREVGVPTALPAPSSEAGRPDTIGTPATPTPPVGAPREVGVPTQEPVSDELEALKTQVATLTQERDSARLESSTYVENTRTLIAEQDARVAAAEAQLLETHRRALLAENRGSVIDELVIGSTVAEMDASLETARAAHARVFEAARAQVAAERPALPIVPPGASGRVEPNPDELSPIQKLTMALGRNGT